MSAPWNDVHLVKYKYVYHYGQAYNHTQTKDALSPKP